jgi:hypothetical protein
MQSMHAIRSIAKSVWTRSTWEKLATVLAVISLIDLSSQLVKWAALIHWIVENYALVKNWLFGWLPFHIPPEWHDYILLFFIIFSVTNVGFYQRTGRTFARQLYLMLPFWDDPVIVGATFGLMMALVLVYVVLKGFGGIHYDIAG